MTALVEEMHYAKQREMLASLIVSSRSKLLEINLMTVEETQFLIRRDNLLQRESITTPLKTENQLLFKSTALGIQKPQRVMVRSHILMCGR
ncbi:hypothetical protein ASC83_02155 [Acidovorax sp. Root402]|nr:hypothetical protein ASC83_02155 [Acidovorax sp. Root402]